MTTGQIPFSRRSSGREWGLILWAAALAAAGGVWALLPPAPIALPAAARDPRVVAGALHVHSTRSDGGGTPEAIAAAASAAGLQFVALADHGDGTRAPDPPTYRSGVLLIDGVEISTDGGHYLAIGMAQAPYPLAGEPRDVVEDVARLGGIGIVAHPGSPKPELAWRAWDAPVDGVEWLNADAEWRDEPWTTLARSALTYFLRPAASVARVLDRPAGLLSRLDRIMRERDLLLVAGADAHGGAGGEGERRLPFPSYDSTFRAFSVRVTLRGALGGDPRRDLGLILDGLRSRRAFTGVDAIAGAPRLSFTAQSGGTRVDMGGRIATGGPVTIRARANGPPGSTIVLLRDGEPVKTTGATSPVGSRSSLPQQELEHTADASPAAYRVEVRAPGAPGNPPVPWILSNAIAVGRAASAPGFGRPGARLSPPSQATTPRVVLFEPGDRSRWTAEHDPTSHAEVSAGEGEGPLSLTYSLGLDEAASPYGAIVRDLPAGLSACDTLLLTMSAGREMRVSVQVREPGGDEPRLGQRWRRSTYVPTQPRSVVVPLNDLAPLLGARRPRPNPGALRSLLLVVDTVNARPGDHGTLRVHRAGCR